jgi:hypothetical protein
MLNFISCMQTDVLAAAGELSMLWLDPNPPNYKAYEYVSA